MPAQLLIQNGFKQVPGWPEYWCDQQGRIASTHRKCWGQYYCLKQKTDKDGYYEVVLQGRGQRKYLKAHQVIAMTYLGTCPAGQVVNHKDGNKKNNNPNNLEYLSPADNERHARRELGKRPVGEKASQTKLTSEQVYKIVELRNTGKTHAAIAKIIGIGHVQVGRILRRENWSHLEYEVKIPPRRSRCQSQNVQPIQTAP